MKQFRFRLQTVLDWRATQLELAKAALQRFLGELASLDAGLEHLGQQRYVAERAAIASLVPEELAALAPFRARLERQRTQLLGCRAECERRVEEQRRVVMEAERQVRLLERLRDRRLAEWTADNTRELEVLAAESFLARLVRSRG